MLGMSSDDNRHKQDCDARQVTQVAKDTNVNIQQAAPQHRGVTWDKQYSPVSTAGALFQSLLAWLPLPPTSVQEEGKL